MGRPVLGLAAALAATAAISAPASTALAAEITHTKLADAGELRDVEFIFISGDIKVGDEEKFRRLSVTYDKAIVALDSGGGALIAAIEIGKLIRIKEYPTLVANESVCTSACALIWVAGPTRFLSSGGRVGFHASYTDVRGEKQETGLGNALVGRYLTLLNLPEKAIIFATAASPEQVLWLTSENMRAAGIEFEDFGEASADPPPIVRTQTRSPTEAPASAQAQRGWVLVADGSDTTKYYLNRESVSRAGRYKTAWIRVDHRTDPKVEYYEAKHFFYYDCSSKRYALKAYVTFDENGGVVNSHEIEGALDWMTVVPDSVGEAQHGAVCG